MTYGTIMIATLADSGSAEALLSASKAWEEHAADGFITSHSLVTDDGAKIVSCIVFENKEKYEKLADDPAQDEWWRTMMAPHVEGEPTWIDGTWM